MDNAIQTCAPRRSIQLVHEHQSGLKPVTWVVGPFLNRLDASGLALTRFGNFTCGPCDGRVNLRVSSVAATMVTGGQRAFFVHAIGEGESCPAITGPAFSASTIEANKYEGRQESERHQFLKYSLASVAATERAFFGADTEVTLTHADHRRRPDVVVQTEAGVLCFDVEISSPLRTTISCCRSRGRRSITRRRARRR